MTEKSFTINLKVKYDTDGSFINARMLKGKSSVSEELLGKLNEALQLMQPSEKQENADIKAMQSVDIIQTTVDIGNDGELAVMNALINISRFNNDFNVYDSSSQTNHGDIIVDYKGKKICIEVKNYSSAVPIAQIDKFHKSISHEEYDIGLLIQLQSFGFAKNSNIKTPIDINIIDGKPVAYITAIDLSLLYAIISILASMINMKSGGNIEQQLEDKKLQMISIMNEASSMRTLIDTQKKSIAKMETIIDKIIKMTI
jgi:hypothetical protein